MPAGQPQPELKLHQECLHFYTCEPFVLSLLLSLPWHFLSPLLAFFFLSLCLFLLLFRPSLHPRCSCLTLPSCRRSGAVWDRRPGRLCRGEGGGVAHPRLTLQFVSQTGRLRHSSNSEANGYPLRLEWVWTLPECSLASLMGRLSI